LLQQALDILNEVKGLRLQYYDTLKSQFDQVVIILLDRNFDELRRQDFGPNSSVNNFQVKIMKNIV